MPCYNPLKGYRSKDRNPSGKRSLVFNSKDGHIDQPVEVPCGQCIGCRLEYSRQWAMRCLHEASLYDDNCFITLTYDNKNLPESGSLRKSHFQLFMKRLRSKFTPQKIRFYHAGEYGKSTRRPHYHALLFGFDFPDKVQWSIRDGFPVWRSEVLEQLWPFGQSEIGSVTFESAAYVARYMVGKFKGKPDEIDAHYSIPDEDGVVVDIVEAEYATMSRRPGIGREWFDKYKCEVFAADSVIVRGKEMKPPKFYDTQYELSDPDQMLAVKRARKRARDLDEETDERLIVRQAVTEARLNLSSLRSI